MAFTAPWRTYGLSVTGVRLLTRISKTATARSVSIDTQSFAYDVFGNLKTLIRKLRATAAATVLITTNTMDETM